MRYFIELSFDGKPFSGWQVQPGQPSVQGALEQALQQVLGSEVPLTGAGRTDAGVHARRMMAHFDFHGSLPPERDLFHLMGVCLPGAIRLLRLIAVPPDAHARFDALSRHYRYFISRTRNPFLRDYAWHYHGPLDVGAMQVAAGRIKGKRDFRAFSKVHTDVSTFICDVQHAAWTVQGDTLVFDIVADRFLRNMVRAIVGTLMLVGRGRITAGDVEGIIQSGDRRLAGPSVPAHGLFLWDVNYPPTLLQAQQ